MGSSSINLDSSLIKLGSFIRGEEKWVDVIATNEKAISHEEYMKEANRKKRLSSLEARKTVAGALLDTIERNEQAKSYNYLF